VNTLGLNGPNVSKLANLLIKLINEVEVNKIRKNKKHGKELFNYAEENDLKCYICGSVIDYTDVTASNSLQLEHHIPRTHGGSKSVDNIFVSCKRCNEAKGNYINWQEAGFNLLHKHFHNIEKINTEFVANINAKINDYVDVSEMLSESLEKHLDAKLIYLVSSLCNYSCYQCGTENDESGECYITLRELTDHFHPLNLMILCEKCMQELKRSFWDACEILPIVRISNV